MSKFPGRRIVPAGTRFDWYMNPEGYAYSQATERIRANNEGIVPAYAHYNNIHAVYTSLPTRFSLADIVLFHPEVTDTVLAPYLAAVRRLIEQLPADVSISNECSQRKEQLLSSIAPLSLDQCPNLRLWHSTTSDHGSFPVKAQTVAIGIGRLLVHKSACYVLLPMGQTASGFSTLCRLIEELLMIAVLFVDKRPQASRCTRRLAADLIDFGRDSYGLVLWGGIKESLLAHVARRAEAPHAPQEIPMMMEQVAAVVNQMESENS